MIRRIEFWYDLISPFSYAATARLGDLPGDVVLEPRVLLLGAVRRQIRLEKENA